MAQRWILGLAIALACGCGEPTVRDDLADAEKGVSSQSIPGDYIKRARARLHHGMFDGALEDIAQALRTDVPFFLSQTERIDVYLLRSEVDEGRGDMDAAFTDVFDARAIATKLQRGDVETIGLERLGQLHLHMGHLAEADAIAAQMLAGGPGSPLFDEGKALMAAVYRAR